MSDIVVTVTDNPIAVTVSDTTISATVAADSPITVDVSALGAPGIGIASGGNDGDWLVKDGAIPYVTKFVARTPVVIGNDKEIQYNDGGVCGADARFKWDKNTKTLRIGVEDDNPLPNNPLAMVGAIDDYLQVNVRNTTEGESASSDYVATADNGTDENYYIDMGINSSVYDVAEYSITGPNDGYLITDGGDLVLCAGMPGNNVIIGTGGTESTNAIVEISDTGIKMLNGASIENRPEIYYGTGSPPSAVGKADGTLFFKYTP